jgi:hypothetical protein
VSSRLHQAAAQMQFVNDDVSFRGRIVVGGIILGLVFWFFFLRWMF